MQKTVSMQQDTYQALSQAKAPGQSFNGKIKELLKKTGELKTEATQ